MLYMCHDTRGNFFFTRSAQSALQYLEPVQIMASFAGVSAYDVPEHEMHSGHIYSSVYDWALKSLFLEQSANELREALDFDLIAGVIEHGGAWAKSTRAGVRTHWTLDELKIVQAGKRRIAADRFDDTMRKFYAANGGLFDANIADSLWAALLETVKPHKDVCQTSLRKLTEVGLSLPDIVRVLPALALSAITLQGQY